MAKSVYGRVRAGKAARVARVGRGIRSAGDVMMTVGPGVALYAPMVGGLLAGVGIIAKYGFASSTRKAQRNEIRTATIARLIGSAQAAKRQSGAAASIARARGVLAQTAAARSMAASRKVVPRPVGQRVRNNDSNRSDGQTEGYYRNQGGKRVYVQGYATPAGRSR